MKRKLVVEAEGESMAEIQSKIVRKIQTEVIDKLNEGFYTGKDWNLKAPEQEELD